MFLKLLCYGKNYKNVKMTNKKNNCFNFFGIKFYNWDYNSIIKKIFKGGYLCAPAAYPLSEIKSNKKYLIALKNADINLLDSGYFCILLRLFYKIKVKKFSGFFFLSKFIKDKRFKKKKLLLINPSNKESITNKTFLIKNGFSNQFSYNAPIYNSIKSYQDRKLFDLIKKIRPRFIIINISGLKQEYLAFNIKKKIKLKTIIFCLGGAISYMTKLQAPINPFIDKYYMGWLVRLIYNPRIFIPRIFKSFLLLKYFI
jgi:UDP-N-acetyl-D-mannosaminuronic acid transferase (WecB/TagA/CpsF family)